MIMQMQKDKRGVSSAIVPIGLFLIVVAFIAGGRLGGEQTVTVNQSDLDISQDLDLASIEEVYDELVENFDGDIDPEAVEDAIKNGIAEAAGDPFTSFLNEEQAQAFDSSLNGEFVGIGAELGREDDQLIIVAPIDGFPAQEAGIRAQDVIVTIDGEDATGLTVEEAVTLIRGEEGVDVTLGIIRGGTEQLSITITRAQITVPSVESEVLEGNIGYLKITRFAEDTSSLSRQFAAELRDQGVDSVILDLRNNSGGFLQSSVDVSGIWLDDKVVVSQMTDGETTDTLRSGSNAILEGVPTVVLVNGGSASASEIVAGALRDHEAATLVGEQTFGKGSVQSLEQLSDGGVLRVTFARWFTPNGDTIDGDGLTPGEIVELSEEDFENDADPQLDRATELLQNN